MPTPSKGERAAMTVRSAPEVAAEVRRRAKAHGVPASDYIAHVLACEVGLPQYAPALGREEHEFPMTG